jgi:hypothetical protein
MFTADLPAYPEYVLIQRLSVNGELVEGNCKHCIYRKRKLRSGQVLMDGKFTAL